MIIILLVCACPDIFSILERLASLPPPPETAEEEKGGLESLDQMSQSKAPLPLSKEEEGSAQERDKLAATRQSVASIDFDNSTIATLESFGSGGIDSFTKNLIVDHTLPSSDQSVTVDEETDSQVDAEPVPEPEPEIVVDMPIPFPCCSAMIIANYIDVVIKNDNHISLRSIFPVKLFMYNCFEAMNEIEQEKFLRGVVPEVSNIPVFVTNSKPEAVIKKVLDEVAYFTSKKRKDADLQRKKEEEEAIAAAAAAAAEEEASLAESLASLSTTKRLKKLNDMKKQKSLEARQRDNAIRAELSRQRKFMYELIQTDQITTIFAAKAGRGAEDGAGKWESPDDQDLISTANAEFANMIANSSKATKH